MKIIHVLQIDGLNEMGVNTLPVETIHSLLVQLQQILLNDSTLINQDLYERWLNLIEKGFHFQFFFIDE